MAIQVLVVLFALVAGCSGNGHGQADGGDASSDSDADSDTDADADSDTDSDTDSDSDSDSDTDSDTDSDSDADSDTGSDTTNDLPKGCQVISPANYNTMGWTGREAMDDDYMVWTWVDFSKDPDQDVLMKHQLSTGIQQELLRRDQPKLMTAPALFAGNVFFFRQTNPSDGYTTEIFRIVLNDKTEMQLTSNDTSDRDPMGGQNGCLYDAYTSPNQRAYLTYFDLDLKKEIVISDYLYLARVWDGSRWIAFTRSYSTYETLYKFDLDNQAAGAQLVDSTQMGFFNMSFNKDTHELVAGVWITGKSNGYDLMAWNMETNERTTLIDDPWDQGLPDYSGHAIAYADSQAAGTGWFGNYKAEVKILDRDTRALRTALPFDTWYGIGLWSHYLAANNVGKWGDTIILCDLEEEGLMGTDGHVCPESGCGNPDGGMDSGIDAGMDGGI
ncbi:MAG: hypothetical protein PHU25_09865 [Deltaproteobacteria bacterium]|nr:hypothetical protein [Deltaproteobacteria bacterium]